jgi:hypothetical protein
MKNQNNIKTILKLFYGYFPLGTNYFTLTYRLNLSIEDWVDTYEYLLVERLIEDWGNNDKQIITANGIRLINEEEICKNLTVCQNG